MCERHGTALEGSRLKKSADAAKQIERRTDEAQGDGEV